MRVGTSSELDWQRLVIQVDARLDEGRALGALAGLLQQRTAASVPPRWLQLDPGTGARHGALAHLGVRGLDQRDAIIAQLRRMQLARGPGADWTEACVILARSDPAQVVNRPRCGARRGRCGATPRRRRGLAAADPERAAVRRR